MGQSWDTYYTGHGSVMGHLLYSMYWWWDTLFDKNGLWTEFKGITDFMQGENLAALTVTTATITTKGAQALALQSDKRALVWIRSDGYGVDAAQAAYAKAIKQAIKTKVPLKNWKYEPPLVEKLTLIVTGLKDGDYTAHWYSPTGAQWGDTVKVQVKNGKLTLALPTLQRDLAVKIEGK